MKSSRRWGVVTWRQETRARPRMRAGSAGPLRRRAGPSTGAGSGGRLRCRRRASLAVPEGRGSLVYPARPSLGSGRAEAQGRHPTPGAPRSRPLPRSRRSQWTTRPAEGRTRGAATSSGAQTPTDAGGDAMRGPFRPRPGGTRLAGKGRGG